jgi:hypothetical protein
MRAGSAWVRYAIALLLMSVVACESDETAGPKLGPLSGTVFDVNGVPANAAAVRARYMPDPNQAPVDRWTDSNGHFDCGQVLAGQWVVTANFSTAWAVADTLVVPAAGAPLKVAVAGTAQGRALLQAASVHASTTVAAPFPLATDITASSGTYFLGGIAPGTWRATFVHSGYRDTSIVFTMPVAGGTVVIPDVLLMRVNYQP